LAIISKSKMIFSVVITFTVAMEFTVADARSFDAKNPKTFANHLPYLGVGDVRRARMQQLRGSLRTDRCVCGLL
jgi:hypothetical protein